MTTSIRLERLKPCLACPGCGSEITFRREEAVCGGCGVSYPVRNGKIYFVSVPRRDDELDGVKGSLKQLLGGRYYSFGVRVLAPTYPFNYSRWVRRFADPSRRIVIDAGCGNNRIADDVICLDMFDYPEVDVVCDLAALPLKSGSVDAFVSRSMFEHVSDPWKVAEGFFRCTRPGGVGVHLIPFLFPYHASPGDFYRFSSEGVNRLFKGWETVEQSNATGPVTLALLVTAEFLAVLFSGGNGRIKAWLYLVFCLALFPFKYLDVLFVGRKSFASLAPSIVSVVRKPRDAAAS